jgi:hypothetical protein
MRTELVKEPSEKSVTLGDILQSRNLDKETPEEQSMNSLTMANFLETRKLDKETESMLLKYDEDGNGHFSKDEVVSIIHDLKETKRTNQALNASNKFFKRLFITAAVVSVLLLSLMFGLSYAVAVLTAKTEVKSDGTLVSKSGTAFIATDSSANFYEMQKTDGNYCMTQEEAMEIKDQALSGRNVIVQFNEFDGNRAFVEQLTASGADIDDESQTVCFKAPELGADKHFCMRPSDSCIPRDSSGRRLQNYSTQWTWCCF